MIFKPRVYVAGPLSHGSLEDNIRAGTEAGMALLRAGFAPLVPHLTCYMGGSRPELLPCGTVHEDWYDIDLPWVAMADAVLRLPGPSRGADLEVQCARDQYIPVFYSLEDLIGAAQRGPGGVLTFDPLILLRQDHVN